MTLESDIIKGLGIQLKRQNDLNERIAIYLKKQSDEARKSPGLTRLSTFNLLNPQSPSPLAIQIVPKNDMRESVAITNPLSASADVLISEEYFDPVTILQHLNDPSFPDSVTAYNVAVPIGFLSAGSNVSLDGTLGVWAYNLGSSGGSPTAALLSIADSIYVTKQPKANSQIDNWNNDGLLPSEQPGGGAIN